MSSFAIIRSSLNQPKGLVRACVGGVIVLSGVHAGCADAEPQPARSTADEAVVTPGPLSENAGPVPADRGSVGSIEVETPARILGRLQAGGFESAEAAALARLETNPTDARTRFLLGVARQKQKRYAAGLAALDEACASSVPFPERRHAGHFRGWCLFYLGRPEEAAEAFLEHLQVSPDEADSHFGLGVARLESGDPETARASFERAIELNDGRGDRRRDLAKAWIRLGDTWWETDHPDEARAAYHKGVIQFADHYEGWEKLARALDRAGDPVKAERARNEARNARRRVGAFVDDGDSEAGGG